RHGVMAGESLEEAAAAFEHAVATADHRWLRDHPAIVTWPGGRFASGALAPDHPLIGRVRSATGHRAGVVGAPYGSDLRLYAAAGVPTVQYGPGAIEQAHSVDESVAIEVVVACAEAYVRLIELSCG